MGKKWKKVMLLSHILDSVQREKSKFVQNKEMSILGLKNMFLNNLLLWIKMMWMIIQYHDWNFSSGWVLIKGGRYF